MSIRLILSIALLAATQCAHAEPFTKHKNHDTVAANSQCDMIYEQPGLTGDMTDATYISFTNAQRVTRDGGHITDEAAMLNSMLENFEQHENLNQPPELPICTWTKLVLKQDTRARIGRAILTYMPSNKNNSMEKLYARRRAASFI